MGARARLVNMGGCHRARSSAGWDAPRPATGRQAGPVGIVGLKEDMGESKMGKRRGLSVAKGGDRSGRGVQTCDAKKKKQLHKRV